MSLSFQIAAGGSTVPEGFYKGKVLAIEPTEHEEYGAGCKWVFEVTEGDHQGE